MCYQMTKSLQLRLIFYTFDIKNLPQHFWHNILIKPIALNCLFIVSTRDYDMAPHYLIIPHNSSLYTHNFTRNIFFFTEIHKDILIITILSLCHSYLFSPSPIIIFLFIFPDTFFHDLSKLLTISWIFPQFPSIFFSVPLARVMRYCSVVHSF